MKKIIPNRKWPVSFILLVLLSGTILGTILSVLVAAVLPGGVVKQFFLTSKPVGWDPFTLNLQALTLTTGFTIDVSVASIIGIAVAWYFLRYFK